MRRMGIVLLAVVFASPGVVAGGDAKKDLKKFEGTWAVHSAKKGGREGPANETKQLRFVFSGDKMTLMLGEKALEGTFKIDPSKKPSQIDMTLQGKAVEGIYKFEDGMLELCLSEPGTARPAEFKSPEMTMTLLLVLKRAKK